jgi:hypothetical protein
LTAHHDPVVGSFFEVYGIGPEVSREGEMAELVAISEALIQEALAEFYGAGEPATLSERAFITCVVFVICDAVAAWLTLDDGSHVASTDLAYEVLPRVMSHHPDPDPDADAKSTFGRAEVDSFQLGLLWSSDIKKSNEPLYAAAAELGGSAISLFGAPRDSESVVRLRQATVRFAKDLLANTERAPIADMPALK